MSCAFEASSFEFKVFGRFLNGIDRCLYFMQHRKVVVSGLAVFSALDEHEPEVESDMLDFVGHRSSIDCNVIADFHDLFVEEGSRLAAQEFLRAPCRYTVSFMQLAVGVANISSFLSMFTRSEERGCV